MYKKLTPFFFVNHTVNRLQRIFSSLAAVLAACLVTGLAQADMVIDTTRVIYPESRREVSFKITNVSKERPAFVQMWLDDGNPSAAPEDVVTPFNLTPPIARLNPDSSQLVRLTYTGDPLPTDRESVFWFNMLQLPPKSAEENKLSFAVRTRIKVFFRPKALRGDPANVMKDVKWRVFKKDNNWVAEGDNTTPYNMSFFGVRLGQNGVFGEPIDGGMVSPKGKIEIVLGPVSAITKPYNQLQVEYVNDYGGATPIELPITLQP
jgi:chaperone protein EcpD